MARIRSRIAEGSREDSFDNLLAALENWESANKERYPHGFWQMVVVKAERDTAVLTTIIKKMLPDKVDNTHAQKGDWSIKFESV